MGVKCAQNVPPENSYPTTYPFNIITPYTHVLNHYTAATKH